MAKGPSSCLAFWRSENEKLKLPKEKISQSPRFKMETFDAGQADKKLAIISLGSGRGNLQTNLGPNLGVFSGIGRGNGHSDKA